jgi:hypothetical protein
MQVVRDLLPYQAPTWAADWSKTYCTKVITSLPLIAPDHQAQTSRVAARPDSQLTLFSAPAGNVASAAEAITPSRDPPQASALQLGD